ncbi:hypothetical protein NC653_000077 [Populus alba x Populus x berolinensis]|uniref:Uncharacterized protein n=1 Tax=Populus alba x Populus x berolinensis TaxID=444605 RepID=A0AAD6RIG2_9ROSI|nr:hypothetical protein NC653_000077 [Populus alba x Populus x berolinensis]
MSRFAPPVLGNFNYWKGSFEDEKTLFRRPKFGDGAGGGGGLVVELDLVGVLLVGLEVDWRRRCWGGGGGGFAGGAGGGLGGGFP